MEEKIKKFLADYRQKNGKTQKEMAQFIGVSYATYQDMEKGIIRKIDGFNKLKAATGFNGDIDIHEELGTNVNEDKEEGFSIKEVIY